MQRLTLIIVMAFWPGMAWHGMASASLHTSPEGVAGLLVVVLVAGLTARSGEREGDNSYQSNFVTIQSPKK